MKNKILLIAFQNALLLALALDSGAAWSQHKTEQPGYQAFTIGSTEVIALSDGTVEVSAHELLQEKEEGSISQLLDRAYLKDPVEVSINTYLIKTPGRLILVDTGSGELFGTSGGRLPASISEAGYSATDVTDILITHIHLDHTGGLLARKAMVFPNATVHVNHKETDFWSAHVEPVKGESAGISANRGAYLAMKPYLDAGKVKAFRGDVELFPGIRTIEFAGHTPGHTVFVLESKGEKLFFWGDLIHVAAVQLEHPDLSNDFDLDKEQAILQREIAYLMAAKEGHLIAADHISFPGIGRIRALGSGYVWVPVPYSVSGRNR